MDTYDLSTSSSCDSDTNANDDAPTMPPPALWETPPPPPRNSIAIALAATLVNVEALRDRGRRAEQEHAAALKREAEAADWSGRPKGVDRQARFAKRWLQNAVRRIYLARAKVYAITERGGVPAYDHVSGRVYALSRRSTQWHTVAALLDRMALADGRVRVLVYYSSNEPELVALPPVAE